MLISKISNLPTYSLVNTQQPEHKLIGWTVKWRQKQLIVKALQQPHQVIDKDKQWLQQCLQKSPIKIVQIDPAVGVTNLQTWAVACKQAKKTIFLRSGAADKLPYLNSFHWRLKQICDFLAAASLLAILSPIILGLIVWQWIKSPQSPVFVRQWRVGQRGQLFELLKFNSLSPVYLEVWQNLPQLFNILRGEMSLVGARPWTLTEVTDLQPKQLTHLPGITGIPEIKAQLAIERVSAVHLAYLKSWSLGKDLRILLQTMSKIFSSGIN